MQFACQARERRPNRKMRARCSTFGTFGTFVVLCRTTRRGKVAGESQRYDRSNLPLMQDINKDEVDVESRRQWKSEIWRESGTKRKRKRIENKRKRDGGMSKSEGRAVLLRLFQEITQPSSRPQPEGQSNSTT